MTFEDWCTDVRRRFETVFGYAPPKSPGSLVELDSRVQERIMRCGIEARAFQIADYDGLAILAHHSLILDDVRAGRSNLWNRYA